jgi:photosynthetic reaction center cytochrome c subunit
MRPVAIAAMLAAASGQDARPTPQIVDTPNVKILKGLTAPEFEQEMQQITVALGVGCNFCHVRGDFASEGNPHKAVARRMLEMTDKINLQFFPGTKTITCYTCHQGEEKPKKPDAL